MTPNPMIIFNTGWMKNYKGYDEEDPLLNGGKEPQKDGHGGEVWNFKAEKGFCYGYVMTKGFSGVDLSRVSNTQKWTKEDKLKDVDIIFTATPSEGSKHIVGWYRGATLYHKHYRSRSASSGNKKDEIYYLTKTRSANAKLLELDERIFLMPKGKDLPGQNQVFYLDTDSRKDLKRKILNHINSHSQTGIPSSDKLLDDIYYINNDKTLTKTERKSFIAARIGQGVFRKALDHRWKGKCALTGLQTRSLLRASHIKPWRDSDNKEKLDPNNGILLSANVDALFDIGLVTFLDTGELQYSKLLEKDTISQLKLPNKIEKKFKNSEKAFLKHHRETIFKI